MSQTLNDQMINAAVWGDFNAVERSLRAGFDIHADNDLALRMAAENGHKEVVELLYKSGAPIHSDEDYAVRMAAYYGHTAVVDLLLKYGADIHAMDDFALRVAAQNGHAEMVDILIQAGADITATHQSDLNKKELSDLLKQHATTAFRGYEAVMMLDDQYRLDILNHLHHGLNLQQIGDELALMSALGLDAAQSSAMWQARHAPRSQEMAGSPVTAA